MTDQPGRTAPSPWEAALIVDWLLNEGRFLPDADDLVRELGQRMLAAGAPLWRLRLSMRTLHPLVTAVSGVWERGTESTERVESTHGLEGRSGYLGSPLEIIGRTRTAYRKRLAAGLSAADHKVLHDLKDRGGTDYFGIPLLFSDGSQGVLVFTTDAADGFADADIDGFTEVAAVLAPITEVYRARRVSLAVAEAYLGPRTGQRVLEGRITRGDIEAIDAAILVSDIRDWTGLNSRLSAKDALALANRYFETVAEAVEANGGEILKFLGDGVLAVFAVDNDGMDAAGVCERALAAARQAFANAAAADPPLDLGFGIGMHFGQVLYGNIGSKTRIDFTVLGQAVNIAARIEGLCGELGKPVLFSQAFADRLNEPATLVTRVTLKGHAAMTSVFTASEDQQP